MLPCIRSAMTCHLLHHSAKKLHVFAIAIANQPTVPAVLLFNVKGLTKYSLYQTAQPACSHFFPRPLNTHVLTRTWLTLGLALNSLGLARVSHVDSHMLSLGLAILAHTGLPRDSYLDLDMAHTLTQHMAQTWTCTWLILGFARGSHLDSHEAQTCTYVLASSWTKEL